MVNNPKYGSIEILSLNHSAVFTARYNQEKYAVIEDTNICIHYCFFRFLSVFPEMINRCHLKTGVGEPLNVIRRGSPFRQLRYDEINTVKTVFLRYFLLTQCDTLTILIH